MRTWNVTWILFLASLASGMGARAEGTTPDGAIERRTKGSDPSEIVSRLELRDEYLDLGHGEHSNATIARGDWAPTRWLLGRLEIPFVSAGGGEHGSASGLGDMLVGLRGKLALDEQWSLLAETAFTMDTATDEVLGSGHYVAVPFGVVVWKPSPAWILGLEYQWAGSFGGSPDREEIRESAIRPQALYHLPRGFWLLADPRIYVNHVDDGAVAFFPEGEFGKVLTDHVEAWVRGGGRVAGDGRAERLGWKAEAGVRYLFD